MSNNDQIVKKIREVATDGKITCTDARKLAEELKVDPSAVSYTHLDVYKRQE